MNIRKPSSRIASRTGILTVLALMSLMLLTVFIAAGCGGTTTTTAPTSGPTTTAATGTTLAPGTTVSTTATTAGGGAGGAQVSLANIAISPTSVTIKVGDTVTWTNNDAFAHHLVGDNGEFDSGNMDGGATFSFTFKTAGTIAYHCSIHPEMKGTIVVQ